MILHFVFFFYFFNLSIASLAQERGMPVLAVHLCPCFAIFSSASLLWSNPCAMQSLNSQWGCPLHSFPNASAFSSHSAVSLFPSAHFGSVEIEKFTVWRPLPGNEAKSDLPLRLLTSSLLQLALFERVCVCVCTCVHLCACFICPCSFQPCFCAPFPPDFHAAAVNLTPQFCPSFSSPFSLPADGEHDSDNPRADRESTDWIQILLKCIAEWTTTQQFHEGLVSILRVRSAIGYPVERKYSHVKKTHTDEDGFSWGWRFQQRSKPVPSVRNKTPLYGVQCSFVYCSNKGHCNNRCVFTTRWL